VAVVLVTEDEPMVREFARLIVHEAGHDSLEAAAVDEALEIIASDRLIDILFTDINLRPSVHGGLELARRALELRPPLCVIYTTGMGLDDYMRSMFVDRAPFLPKPYTPETLSRAIDEVLLARGPIGFS
jgi:two-component system, response regulator PdtaR